VEGDTTTIHAQFKGVNPNEETVEVNVRRTVFYPAEPGVDYITVRGFILRHAATQWAPPTAEQIGLIGTHWSKGWIIEDNIISHSRCTGITLGKYGDQWDNTSEDTAEGYVDTINRALENGWSRDNIGSHIVRNNTISHCEQAGLVGSMGAVFSTIAGNTIHDIHVQQFFTGAEMAGIKIHAAIDTTISDNRIYRTCRGIWLDWMTQGTRVTRNLLYENTGEDLFVEVNHGPFLVDNNFFLSRVSLLDMSQGGAYAHNLMTGSLVPRPELNRETPYHPAHTTAVAGLRNIEGGDSRFFNNIFAGGNGLVEYRKAALPMYMAGNVYMNGARPVKAEEDAVVFDNINPGVRIEETEDAVYLHLSLETGWRGDITRAPVTSERLGKAAIPELPWENPDGTPVRIDSDYSGRKRDGDNPPPGPLLPAAGEDRIKVWPK
jgi:alpha-L-arabinofuranosidase